VQGNGKFLHPALGILMYVCLLSSKTFLFYR
jgi:hypothetical protein